MQVSFLHLFTDTVEIWVKKCIIFDLDNSVKVVKVTNMKSYLSTFVSHLQTAFSCSALQRK